MESDSELVWELFRHIFPEFSFSHVAVYKLLWQIEPMGGGAITEQLGLGRATVYRVLKELVMAGLVRKTNFKPVGYFAENPVKVYSMHSQKIIRKLKKGKKKLKKLVDAPTNPSSEIYLIKNDGGQWRLLNRKTRQSVRDEYELREIRDCIDELLRKAGERKLKAQAVRTHT